MTRVYIKQEDIERVLDGGKRLTIRQLMARLGVSHPRTVCELLRKMCDEHRAQRSLEHVEEESPRALLVYFTGAANPVGKPYPRLSMTGELTGYESEFRQRAALCMVVRK